MINLSYDIWIKISDYLSLQQASRISQTCKNCQPVLINYRARYSSRVEQLNALKKCLKNEKDQIAALIFDCNPHAINYESSRFVSLDQFPLMAAKMFDYAFSILHDGWVDPLFAYFCGQGDLDKVSLMLQRDQEDMVKQVSEAERIQIKNDSNTLYEAGKIYSHHKICACQDANGKVFKFFKSVLSTGLAKAAYFGKQEMIEFLYNRRSYSVEDKQQALEHAIDGEQVDTVKWFLKSVVPRPDAFSIASGTGNIPLLKLIEATDLKLTPDQKNQCFLGGIESGSMEMVQYLFNRRIMNEVDSFGRACYSKHSHLAKFFLQQPDLEVSNDALSQAVRTKDLELIDAVLKDQRVLFIERGIQTAIKYSNVEIVMFLLQHIRVHPRTNQKKVIHSKSGSEHTFQIFLHGNKEPWRILVSTELQD
jgi:hypothetical protein